MGEGEKSECELYEELNSGVVISVVIGSLFLISTA